MGKRRRMVSIQNNKLCVSFSIPIPSKYRGGGVAVFRSNNGHPEVLLGLRANNPGRGLWSFPGGGAEGSEKLTSAGIREFKEETGVQLYGRYITRTGIFKIKMFLFEWDTVIIESTQNIDLSQKPNPKYGEFISIRWIPISELENYKLHRWVKNVVTYYQSDKMKKYNPKKPSNLPLLPAPKTKETREKGVNYLFDVAEMVLTKVDRDGTKYFKPRYALSGKSQAIQEALYGV
jgi:8-oxo-dGTP pyrophosphatase MutT (NUDIX family)